MRSAFLAWRPGGAVESGLQPPQNTLETSFMTRSRLFAAGMAAALAFGAQSSSGRAAQPGPTPAAGGPFDHLHWRQIGPAAMSGRISDIAVYEANTNIWYVGTAHGGVWKTVNNGTTFEPQFQDQGLMSI